MANRAVFLDRDGTLVHPRHYPTTPEQLVPYDGITYELKKLQGAGFRLVVVTNQSGLARGYFDRRDLDLMHASLAARLREQGVHLDAIYHCPHHPEGDVAELAIECTCRKPRPGMLFTAAADLQLDLDRSWLVGDILDDIEAGNRVGCRTVLVDLGTESPPTSVQRWPDFTSRDTLSALQLINDIEGLGPAAERTYSPPAWIAVAAAGVESVRA